MFSRKGSRDTIVFNLYNKISKLLSPTYGFLGFQCQDFSTFYRSTLSNPEYNDLKVLSLERSSMPYIPPYYTVIGFSRDREFINSQLHILR
jgi:hypothetical protein